MKTFVLTGPESTGKTWLAGLLAGHYDTSWNPEFLREFYNTNQQVLEKEMKEVAEGQIKTENDLFSYHLPLNFLDTNIISLKVYHKYYFKTEPDWFSRLYDPKKYSYYLLLDTSVPWIKDPQRDSPTVREELFSLFRLELESLDLPYKTITGDYQDRLSQCIDFVDKKK